MKRTLKLIIISMILLSIVPATLSVFTFCLPPQYDDTFLGELKYKQDLLQNTEGNRIIIIGGSSVAFGQYSDLIESELSDDYSVINFGMYAGLGSTVMLDLAKPYIREGDIVIFSPEQTAQTLSMYFNSEAMWQAVDGKYSLLTNLPKDKLSAMIGQFSYFAVKKYNHFRNDFTLSPTDVYSRASFNSYGDIIYDNRNKNIMSNAYDSNTPIYFSKDIITQEFISYINDFAKTCKERGASIYYRFCPMNSDAITTHDENEIDEYYYFLQNQLDFEIIGHPNSSIMEKEWFYDTNFHLNSFGALFNTRSIAIDIKSILNDSSPVKINMPDMPNILSQDIINGDNSDENSFVYENIGGELCLIELTDEGQSKESLIIPVEHESLPVTSFSPSLFHGNTVIKEITVQSNITRIENGSFDGCSSLERLIINNLHPETCSVGEDLLLGTDCNIYAPQESVFSYLTNYFWSIHTNRIYANDEFVADGTISIENNWEIQHDYSIYNEPYIILYKANGGFCKDDNKDSVSISHDSAHIRVNTALGTKLFERDGYVLTGWNTKADGSGEHIGFGSRTERKEGLVLYAQWEESTDESNFIYEVVDGEIHITKYLGSSNVCTVPEQIEGLPVRRISSYAFENAQIQTVYLPPTVFAVERYAFSNSSIGEIYLYDTLYYIYDESFVNCNNLTTLYINAATKPVYSGTYFDAFSGRFDWLLSIRDQKKIVLFSGSSGRYGYDSPAIIEAFPDYQVANMGVYAYTNALPQLMIIKSLMQEDDILLSAPEFDTIKNQFCTTNALDVHFYAMTESNYDAITLLDLQDYTLVFDSLQDYLTSRSVMGKRSYSICPSNYDDDGNEYDYPTYNKYGDFVIERPNGECDELLMTYLADYTISAFPEEVIKSMNAVYKRFLDDGIKVYFTYAPRNRSSLTPGSTPLERANLDEYLCNNLCVPVISNIENYIYSGIYFYLIDNHLSDKGVQIRTEQIIEDLKCQLGSE